MNSFRAAMLMGTLAGLGVIDPFALNTDTQCISVNLEQPKEGEPFSNDPASRKRKNDNRRKKRNRKNKRGF